MQISKDLYGLVVCGGQSSRMGTDKSLLVFHDKPQRYFAYEMLTHLCSEVFLSCNREQATDIPAEFEILMDSSEYEQIGPMAALLTAFSTFQGKDFLVVGCDYPLINKEVLISFLQSLGQKKQASAFFNPDNKYEPLLAWYSRDCAPLLKSFFERNKLSLQHFLRSVEAQKYHPKNQNVMTSVDTPEEFRKMKLALAQQNIDQND